MLPTTARPRCRIQIGERCLDNVLSGGRVKSVLVALIATLAFWIAASPLMSPARAWIAQGTLHEQAMVTATQLSAPRVPVRPVEGLERIDLSVVASNPSDRVMENLTLELAVLRPDGSNAMTARQSHITLQPHDSRAIYWAWRIPAQLASGQYAVVVRTFDSEGRFLGSDEQAKVALQVVGRDD